MVNMNISEERLDAAFVEFMERIQKGNEYELPAFKKVVNDLFNDDVFEPEFVELVSTPDPSLEKIVKLTEENLKVSVLIPKQLLDINRNLEIILGNIASSSNVIIGRPCKCHI